MKKKKMIERVYISRCSRGPPGSSDPNQVFDLYMYMKPDSTFPISKTRRWYKDKPFDVFGIKAGEFLFSCWVYDGNCSTQAVHVSRESLGPLVSVPTQGQATRNTLRTPGGGRGFTNLITVESRL